jgi:hypothetical protein
MLLQEYPFEACSSSNKYLKTQMPTHHSIKTPIIWEVTQCSRADVYVISAAAIIRVNAFIYAPQGFKISH